MYYSMNKSCIYTSNYVGMDMFKNHMCGLVWARGHFFKNR